MPDSGRDNDVRIRAAALTDTLTRTPTQHRPRELLRTDRSAVTCLL